MATVMDFFWQAPPVTRTLVALTFIESVLVHSQLMSYARVLFYLPFVFKIAPEPWRLLTSFCLTGSGFSFIMDLYLMWTYASQLETESPRFSRPGDFFTYIVFCCSVIVATSGLYLGTTIFTSALILSLIYTYAQDNRGKTAHFYIIQIPVEFLPWAMLTLTLVFGGYPAALSEGMGIIAAHSYDFLTRLYPTFQGGRNWVQTPAWVARAFGADARGQRNTSYGVAFRPGAGQTTATAGRAGGSSSSSSGGGQSQAQNQGSGPLPRGWASGIGGSWGGRGAGRRLGGD
ncbi:MAG: hypothetical protein Q9160_002428 [Pyrenula sp. 1 TL-2023]